MSTALDKPRLSPELFEIGETAQRPDDAPQLRLNTPGWERIDPPWLLVESAINACYGKYRSGEADAEYGSYCVLSLLKENTFVQTAFCPEVGIAWRLEWRATHPDGSYAHYYAVEPENKDADAGCVMHSASLLTAFKAFYENKAMPDGLVWKRYEI